MTLLFSKIVAGDRYFHVSQLDGAPVDARAVVERACGIGKVEPHSDFNVVRIAQDQTNVSLLDYPGFFEEGFPTLRRHWSVGLQNGVCRFRTYQDSLNPPILHRKELLLREDAPERASFAALTSAAEQIGLFEVPHRIGFRHSWERLLGERGYKVVGHDLVPIGNVEASDAPDSGSEPTAGIARHLTALTRYGFSAPIQTLARFGFLDGSKTVFDYGCGRGDDIRGLKENGIEVSGWDPHFAASEERRNASIVNLGFVINVIEDIGERIAALRGAYELADELLVVAAMLANQDAVRGTPYGDGVLTSRNTFQKYYTQEELRDFIAEVLGEEPVPVGPGVFYVFKDQDSEQRFQYGRLENRRNVLRLAYLSRPARIPAVRVRVDRAQEKYEEHRALLDPLWELWVALGREPDKTEVANLDAITGALGSLGAALRFIRSRKEEQVELLERSRKSRIEDLTVYLAQGQFAKRKPYRHLENRLQRDIKEFFGDYRNALEHGRQVLFRIPDLEAINNACVQASQQGIGWLEEGHSLQLHTSLVEQLPALLRTYVHCGTLLYGDVSSADLIKIHIRSGKLTLMKFDDFSNKALPRMFQRIKINLRQQGLDVFEYGDMYTPPYLYGKSRFINEEFPNYSEQVAFEEELEGLQLNFDGYGPRPEEFDSALASARYVVDGFQLARSQTIPSLDDRCGKWFSYRSFIECGETQKASGIANLPTQPGTYTALYELTSKILDPVIDYFGGIKLTYGFCSQSLAKAIPGRIAPELDQHAGHELNRLGRPVCGRLGVAVDFLVEDENMGEVRDWIASQLPFDRLYYYGPDKPLHVSYGPEHRREVVHMVAGPTGRLVPKRQQKQTSASHG